MSKILESLGKVSIFGWLDRLPVWNELAYPVKGAILRGLKAGLSVLVSGLLVSATAGTLFPVTWGPQLVFFVTIILQGLDKYIREWNIKEENSNIPLAEEIPEDVPVNTDATVVEKTEDGEVTVNTDATVPIEPEPDTEPSTDDTPVFEDEPVVEELPEVSVENVTETEVVEPDLPSEN